MGVVRRRRISTNKRSARHLRQESDDYVYGFHAETPDHGTGDQLSLIKGATTEKYLCAIYRTHQSGCYTASFALTESGCKILFVAPAYFNGGAYPST